ncbi:acyl-CoA/acyl-ACP dehydrogenase [Streptomyces cellulosae]|uniref:Acyl-CoA/acyl-ACP dehydrogenase n=1 Tax=Streptomyces althioticus TaxID=83380 RepID=A0ABZ1YFT7_9ACTN|nr:acyl-CoA/acyl-ACP dehydrogenase [Streptomyces cellulosae]WTB93365.1 acyl-CoA/acyl-ACP dehydrogenase [Streptomyces cellulosae]WTC60757.1 acyl-CoA/acyl-ACP dehydrogenase [Streptomyces cellulosae]
MDGYLTRRSHEQLRAQVRSFIVQEIRPRLPLTGIEARLDPTLIRLMARKGWVGLTVPKAYGGPGAGHVAKLIVTHEIARVSPGLAAELQACQLGLAGLLNLGSEQLKRTWLPRIVRGEILPTITVTGRDSGSHIKGITATARQEGDEWVVNGGKAWIGASHVADIHCVVLRTSEGTGDDCLTAFLVEADREGVRLLPHQESVALEGFSFGEVQFADCRIPDGNRIGGVGEGEAVASSSSVLYGRLNLGAVALGILEAILEAVVEHTTKRYLYGKPLIKHPVVNDQVGEIQAHVTGARMLAYLAAHLLDRGEDCDTELMTAKYEIAEKAVAAATLAMEIGGAYSLFPGESPIPQLLLDAHAMRPPAGTPGIQRLRLGQQAAGSAKGVPWSRRFASPRTSGVLARFSVD